MKKPSKLVLIGLDAAVPDLIEEFSRDGRLPNLTRLMEKGTFSRAYYSIPGVTPVCWASVVTGAYPGTHGIVDFSVHLPGTSLDESSNAFRSDLLQAQTFWEAAEEVGKRSATVNFPGAWPPVTRDGIWVAGLGSPATGSPFEIKSSSCFVAGRSVKATRDGTVLAFHPVETESQGKRSGDREARLRLTPDKDPKGDGPEFRLVAHYDLARGSYHRLALHRVVSGSLGSPSLVKPPSQVAFLSGEVTPWGEAEAARSRPASTTQDPAPRPVDGSLGLEPPSEGTKVADLTPGQWSPWLQGYFLVEGEKRLGTFRFKLTELSPDLSSCKLYCSQIMATDKMARPASLGPELVDAVGPMVENSGTRGYERGWVDEETVLEEAAYKANWLAEAGVHLLDHHGVDLLFLKWHFLDHVQHTFWGRFDPLSPWFVPEEGEKYQSLIARAYAIADRLVGKFLERAGEDTLVLVVSDHGHTPHLKAMSINNLLAQEGLITWHPGASGRPVVDWAKTRAYAGPDIGNIYINLQGRDPQGIVKTRDEYQRLQEEIINILLDYRDPETGERPVEIALKKEDAPLLGLWGDRCGDVFYLMRPGYSGAANWFPLTQDQRILVAMGPEVRTEGEHGQFKFIAPKFQSAHGYVLPTVKLGKGSEQAVFILAGPGVRQGYRRERPIHLVDIAPTLAALLDIPVPRNSEGAIIHDCLV